MNKLIELVCDSPRRLLAAGLAVVAVSALAATLVLQAATPEAALTLTPAGPAPTASGLIVTDALAVDTARTYLNTRMVYRPDQTPATWLTKVAALAVPENRADLELVDPTQLGHESAVYGLPTVRYLERDSAMVAVPIVGGNTLIVTMEVRGGHLLVFTVQPNVGD